MLIDHMACDELIAQAYHANFRVEKASMLNRAFYIGSKIRHPYLMKIIVELEVLGIFCKRLGILKSGPLKNTCISIQALSPNF